MKVWVDDIREAPEGWVWAKTDVETIDHLLTGEVSEISFDHDLGDECEWNGYQILNWIEKWVALTQLTKEEDRLPKVFHVHSANPVGRQNMQRAIDSIERLRA